MITYVGIDPGVHECGVAIEHRDSPDGPASRQAWQAKGSVVSMLYDVKDSLCTYHDVGTLYLCVEGQQFYGTERSKGDPNDLIRLAQVAGGMLWGLASSYEHCVHAIPLPRQWKGSTPKAIHHARLARDYPHWVEPVTRDTPKSKQHHVWDAVGLLEWHKERSNS